MDLATEQIRAALDRAEAEIRELGAEAFRAGDDTGAAQARDIVLAFKSLRAELNGRTPDPSQAPSKLTGRPSKRSKRTARKSRKARKPDYPRFYVRNGSLIRVGWSKKQKSQYEHRASRDTFDRTVTAMAQVAATGPGPFTADQIIERVNDSDNSCPSYQVYVVIGLLRDHGYVEQVGREGYRLLTEDLQSSAQRTWDLLV